MQIVIEIPEIETLEGVVKWIHDRGIDLVLSPEKIKKTNAACVAIGKPGEEPFTRAITALTKADAFRLAVQLLIEADKKDISLPISDLTNLIR